MGAVSFWLLVPHLSVPAQSALHSSQIDRKPELLLHLLAFIGFPFLSFPAAGCQRQLEGSIVNLGLPDELLFLYYA